MAFTGEERSAAQLLDHNLCSMENEVDQFAQALALADYCDNQRAPFRSIISEDIVSQSPDFLARLEHKFTAAQADAQFIRWKMLAISFGAITLYNFAECKQAVEGLLNRCPSLKDKLDRETYAEASRSWKAAFPGYVHVRLNVAHSGKLFNAPGKWEKHTVPGTGFHLGSMVSDRVMTTSVNNSMASYALTHDSLMAFTAVKDLIYRAYQPVADFARNLPTVPDQEAQPRPAQD